MGADEKLQQCKQKLQYLMQRVADLPPYSHSEDDEVHGGSIPAGFFGDPHQALPAGPSQAILPPGGWRCSREKPCSNSGPVAIGALWGVPCQGHMEVGHPFDCNTRLPFSYEHRVSFTDFCEGQTAAGENPHE